MSNRLPRKDCMRDHPMFGQESCDRCHRDMASYEELWESGAEFLCRECFERKVADQHEAEET